MTCILSKRSDTYFISNMWEKTAICRAYNLLLERGEECEPKESKQRLIGVCNKRVCLSGSVEGDHVLWVSLAEERNGLQAIL